MTNLALPERGVDWSRDFIADHAQRFLEREIQLGASIPGEDDKRLVAGCADYLMALCHCTRRTAETRAAQAVAELACRNQDVTVDLDRSTAYALFVRNRLGQTRVVSADKLALLFQPETPSLALTA